MGGYSYVRQDAIYLRDASMEEEGLDLPEVAAQYAESAAETGQACCGCLAGIRILIYTDDGGSPLQKKLGVAAAAQCRVNDDFTPGRLQHIDRFMEQYCDVMETRGGCVFITVLFSLLRKKGCLIRPVSTDKVCVTGDIPLLY